MWIRDGGSSEVGQGIDGAVVVRQEVRCTEAGGLGSDVQGGVVILIRQSKVQLELGPCFFPFVAFFFEILQSSVKMPVRKSTGRRC